LKPYGSIRPPVVRNETTGLYTSSLSHSNERGSDFRNKKEMTSLENFNEFCDNEAEYLDRLDNRDF
jgi:hypothetical protein